MGPMAVEEIYKDRKKFSRQVFEMASSDLVNMGITVVFYTLKDIRDEEGYLKVENIDTEDDIYDTIDYEQISI